MSTLRRPGVSFALDAARATSLALIGLSVIVWLVLTTQALSAAPVMPGPKALLQLLSGLIPAVCAISLPLSLLFGCTAAAWAWAEDGQLLALHTSGLGGRRLVPALLVMALMMSGAQGILTHWLEPQGRRSAAKALAQGTQGMKLQPGQASLLGDVLVHAEDVIDGETQGLLLARGEQVLVAERGNLDSPGELHLKHGEIISLPIDAQIEWRLRFDEARVPLDSPSLRLDPPTLSADELRGRIERMEAQGRDPWVEKTTWYKRSTIPGALPLLAILGLCLGARRVRPAVSATATGIGWWTTMRVCDHEVATLGAEVSTLIPLAGLALFTAICWRGWSER
jgi:lipopolysaccharide export LptBFGC system permease protein LptF